MNSIMRIRIEAMNRASGELKKVQAEIDKMTAKLAAMNAAGGAGGGVFHRGQQSMEKYGKNLQWTGRQIEYNFTLPIALAGGMATKFALDNEKAFTKVKKVYGDLRPEMQAIYKKELPQLQEAFEVLSNIFGVNQAAVNDVAAGWASAGSAGAGLAKNVRLTLEAMILGEMDAVTATESLIAVQAQYQLSSKGLKDTLAELNMVENETAITFPQLIEGFTRAAGSAAGLGVSTRELASMLAVLTPATGSATVAGNSLKTIFSRLTAPTRDAAEMMGLMGINIEDMAWTSKTASERLKYMAEKFTSLSDAQQAQASSIIASRYQVARFDVLMRDLADSQGTYAHAMDATSDANRNALQYQNELSAVLASNPKAFEIMKTQLQNLVAKAIIPMIPAILSVFSVINKLVRAFTNLSPATQQMIMMGLVAVAAVGTIARLAGAFILLFSKLGGVLRVAGGLMVGFGKVVVAVAAGVGKALGWMYATFLGPWGLALVAAAALAYIFRDKLGGIVEAIKGAFYSLPPSIVNVMTAVVRIISAAAKQVYEWLSYINPFAHHSPSLVEQVNAGVDVIAKKYASLGSVGAPFRQAIADMNAFKSATSSFVAMQRSLEQAEQRKKVAQAAGGGGVAAYDQMIAATARLRAGIEAVTRAYAAQMAVVDMWKAKLDAANATLDAATAKLEALEAAADAASSALQAAQSHLDALASTPITGMGAMSDAIFANTMAQKKLQLQILMAGKAAEETAEQVSSAYDDAQKQVAALAGDIEMLRGEQQDLRLSGATNEILGPIQEQIDALEAARRAAAAVPPPAPAGPGGSTQADALQAQMDELMRQGEILQLQNDLTFMPMQREIDAIVDTSEEMDFDTLIQALKDARDEVDRLTIAEADAAAARDAQQVNVDGLTAVRDEIEASYDREKEKLDLIGELYDDMKSQLSEMESIMGDFATSTGKAADEMTRLAEEFAANAGGDWEEAFGDGGILGYEEGDIQALIDEWTAEMEKSFGNLDMFAPLKNAWNKAKEWLKENTPQGIKDFVTLMKENFEAAMAGAGLGALIGLAVLGPFGAVLGAGLGAIFGTAMASLSPGDLWGGITSGFDNMVQTVKEKWDGFIAAMRENPFGAFIIEAWGVVGTAIGTIVDGIGGVIQQIGGFFRNLRDALAPEFEKWKPLMDKLQEAAGHIWAVLKVVGVAVISAVSAVAAGIAVVLAGVWKVIGPMITNTLQPMLDGIVSFIRGVFEIVRGIFTLILDLINGDFGNVVNDVLTILNGIGRAVYGVFQFLAGILGGIIYTIIDGIITAFTWLYDVLVGHSIIPDMIDAIVAVFNWLVSVLGPIMQAIINVIVWAWENVIQPAFAAIGWYISNVLVPVFKFLWDGIKFVFDAISGAIKWAWENVIKPIWEFLKLYVQTVLIPIFKLIWAVVKEVFDKVSAGIKFAWENVIKPVFELVWAYITDTLLPIFKKIWDTVSDVFTKAGEFIKTTWNEVIKPLFEGIKTFVDEKVLPIWTGIKDSVLGAFRGIRDTVGSIWDGIGSAIATGINMGISAVNLLIDGLNAVASILPGLDFNIPRLQPFGGGGGGGGMAGGQHAPPEFATGTAHLPMGGIGAGFRTNGPRAIVGEGRVGYPEYVVPTDPRYRANAERLTASLVKDISFGIGGLPNPFAVAADVVGTVAGAVREGAAMAAFAPFNLAFDAAAGQIPWSIPRDIAIGSKNRMYDWVKGHQSGGILNMAHGGSLVVGARPGGTLMRVGEAGQRERVTVTPLGQESGGDKIVQINGNLSFPNITSGSDAEDFLDKLRSMGGD